MTMFGDGILSRGVQDGGILARRGAEVEPRILIYTASRDDTGRILNSNGEELAVLPTGPVSVNAVAVSPDSLFLGGRTAENKPCIRKYDLAGGELWEAEIDGGTTVNDIAVDVDGFSYAAIQGANPESGIIKISQSGEIIWATNVGYGSSGNPIRLSVYGGEAGGIYVAGSGGVTQERTRKFDKDGNFLWELDRPHDDFGDVAALPDGRVWCGVGTALYLLEADGSILGEVSIGDRQCLALAVNGGNLYAITRNRQDYSDFLLHCYSPLGDLLWNKPLATGTPTNMALDTQGNLYISAAAGVFAFDSGGDLLWSFEGHSGAVESVACTPGDYGAFPEQWPEEQSEVPDLPNPTGAAFFGLAGGVSRYDARGLWESSAEGSSIETLIERGNGNDGIQSEDAYKAKYTRNYNGDSIPSIIFNGSAYILPSALQIPPSQPWTRYSVIRFDDLTTLYAWGDGANRAYHLYNTGSSLGLSLNVGGTFENSGTIAPATPVIITGQNDGTRGRVWLNDTLILDFAIGASSPSSAIDPLLGARRVSGNSGFHNLLEAHVFDDVTFLGAHNQTTREFVWSQLSDEWALLFDE